MTVIFGTACAPGEDAEEEEDSTAGFSGYFFNPSMSGLETQHPLVKSKILMIK